MRITDIEQIYLYRKRGLIVARTEKISRLVNTGLSDECPGGGKHKKYIELFDIEKTESDTDIMCQTSCPSSRAYMVCLFIGAELYAMRWLYMFDVFEYFE